MNPKLRFFLAGLAAVAFCFGFATSFDWRVMLLLKLNKLNLQLY